nr:MAG TPA: hypothetical protein [Caudoviricetes sp.]
MFSFIGRKGSQFSLKMKTDSLSPSAHFGGSSSRNFY